MEEPSGLQFMGVTKSQTQLRDKRKIARKQTEMQETQVRSLGWDYPLEKEKAIQSSILVWEIPWKEEPVGYSPRDR